LILPHGAVAGWVQSRPSVITITIVITENSHAAAPSVADVWTTQAGRRAIGTASGFRSHKGTDRR
jgi:hypothetical protein